jgi:hypothetical protein
VCRWRIPLTRTVVAVITAQLIVIALTLADEDGRYFAYSLPLIGLLAAGAVTSFSGRDASARTQPHS